MRCEQFTYKKTPQGDLSAWVHYPTDWKATDKRAGIVFFFGGGWRAGNIGQFTKQADYLAERGMVAVRADYRVSSRHKTKPDKCVEDAKSAVRWMRAEAAKLGVDPNRVVASGGSAGAHIALCTGVIAGLNAAGEDANTSSVPNLMVLFNPVVDCLAPGVERLMSDRKLAARISPMQHVRKGAPPAIFFYGSEDRLGGPAKPFVDKANLLGNEAVLYTAAGQGHGFFNRAPWFERTIHLADEFLAAHGYLEGKPTVELPEGKLAMDRYAPTTR
jgi:acetyl esterase/lipase